MKSSPPHTPPRSNPTPADLNEKRREVLESLSHGAQLTQEVLEENERLLAHLEQLRTENTRLKSAVETDDAIRKLIEKIEELELEKRSLLARRAEEAKRHVSFADTVRDLEKSLNDLANLYVAANSLHSTLSLRGTMRRLNEVLEQLVGVQAHVLYLCSDGAPMRAVEAKGLSDSERSTLDKLPASVREVAEAARASVDDQRDASTGTLTEPAALFPLTIDGNVVGVLSVVRSFSHKPTLTDTDFQMFRFLGQHAAIALMSAGLYASAGSTFPAADAFGNLES